MTDSPAKWRPVRTNKVKEGLNVPQGTYTEANTHFKGEGQAVLISSNNPSPIGTKVDISECIISFLEDKMGTNITSKGITYQSAPVIAINPTTNQPYDNKWGVRSYDWTGIMRRVEFRHIFHEHGVYMTTNKDFTWLNCFFHDIGSQAIQIRPCAIDMALGDAANVPGEHLVENCLIYKCGNLYGSRSSHAIKWFAFKKLNDSTVPSETSVTLKETAIIHPGGEAQGDGSESYGAVFAQGRPRFHVFGGIWDYHKPAYDIGHFQKIQELVIDGLTLNGGTITLADMDNSKITIKNCKGNGTLKMGHIIGGHFKPDVFKNRPITQGFTQ